MFKNKNNILLSLIFTAFCVLSFLVGLTHEAWLDEAQSWLIARDCSFYDIMFTRCSYEGTPFLWFYILKIFILLGWSYKYLFVISWLFACLGVFILLFKTNISNIFKITIPFTFYIFYQYNIIARPYCLFFPVLCLIAVFYNKRFERPYLYCGLLVLLASIHAYAFVIAFVLFCFYIYSAVIPEDDILSSRTEHSESERSSVARCHPEQREGSLGCCFSAPQLISISAVFLCFAFIALISMKNPDCDYVQKNIFLSSIEEKLVTALLRGYFNLNTFFSFFSALFLTLSLYYLAVKTFCRNKRQLVFFAALNLSVYISMVLVNFYDWHLGIVPLTLLFSCLILKSENNISVSFKTNKVFYIVCMVVVLTQIFFSVKNSYLEIHSEYDGANTVAKYLKQNNFTEDGIAALGCRAIAIQPYFKENIYMNKDTTYYHWSKKGFLDETEKTKKLISKAKVFITDGDMLKAVFFKDILDYVYDNFYEDITVDSYMCIKGVKFPSSTTYHVFIREDNL